jgi:hypothetical protein
MHNLRVLIVEKESGCDDVKELRWTSIGLRKEFDMKELSKSFFPFPFGLYIKICF